MSGEKRALSCAEQPIGEWVASLAAKQPTPGGGAAAAVAAAIGAASGAMAAIYTTRKKDEEAKEEVHGTVATKARKVSEGLTAAATSMVFVGDKDAEAYAELQATWKKDCALSEDEKKAVQQKALSVPVDLVRSCHEQAAVVADFLPQCNPNIVSDAKVALHLLSGAARAAFQTVLVNSPPEELKAELRGLLDEMAAFEAKALPPSA
mmetsp:Transcript_98089/g.282963  ORF Transcript_98089/g.282963 Transcript_98089/m.282963 type:complete len:207 (+) Transcript_98089:68-688(+)